MKLKTFIEDLNIPYSTYIRAVEKQLIKNNLHPQLLTLADDNKHKFNYDGVNFGSVINKDYIIYKILEKKGIVEAGTADKKRKAYRARAKAIYDKSIGITPSFLAYNILW